MSDNLKACIVIISSRYKCLPHCLKSLWENFNKDYDYPVYVHYFDNIYDSEYYRKKVDEICPQRVFFKPIPYNTPSFLEEKELYYNKKHLWYARTSFSIKRKGYLHMCNFTSNMYGYENTELEKYDFVMTHDDESGYDTSLDYNPFKTLSETEYNIGAFFVGQRLKNGAPHQGHLDTRVSLWQFTKDFLQKENITPKSKALNNLLKDPNAEYNFHFLDWCDTYVIKNEVFETALWKKWIEAVNKNGGIYKHRWGDNEIISLFAHMIQDKIYDFATVKEGIHNQGKFRGLQDYAPGVKDVNK